MNTETVTVACKLPNGMTLHTYADGVKHTVTLKGARLPIHPKTGRELRTFDVAGDNPDVPAQAGYGLTPNVRRDVWEKIEAESRDTPPFKAGLIFAAGTTDTASAMASEMAPSIASGLEAIDPEKGLPGKIARLDDEAA